jgi:hypothetical protein
MCHFTSAGYEDLVLLNKQNDWIIVAKRKSKERQAKKLVTAKQQGKFKSSPCKLKSPPYKLKPPPNVPKKQLEDTKPAWEKKPMETYECCGA